MKHSFFKFITVIMCACFMCGCSSGRQEITSGSYSFGIGKGNYSDTFLCYLTREKQAAVLDYDSMKTTMLCNKPNCTHAGDDCIENRPNGSIPVFGEQCAYYFVDDEPRIEQNSEGKADLVLSSALCRYDFGSNTEKQLMQVQDACVGENCKGLLLDHDVLYFVENKLGRTYDEAGALDYYRSHGGALSLHAVSLSDMKVSDLCELYDVEALEQYYPLAGNSGSVTMQGKYDNKIYFNVVFALDETGAKPGYYVTYYDLTDGSYHGTPEDYAKIESGKVMYLSDDALVICRNDGKAEVYRKENAEPVILEDEYYFVYGSDIMVDQDYLFCADKVFDLNTGESRNLEALQDEKHVIAKYGDSYITARRGLPGDFEKISAKKILN